MRLEVHERIALLSILPTKGDYAGLKTIRRAREMISFSPDEIKFYELVQDGGQTKWSTAKASEQIKDVPVDEYTTNVIREKLAELNTKDELTEQYMSVYEKFVIDYR